MNSIPDQPLISVIIPVYNGSKYIEKCLSAIKASTYSSIEVIVVDDCSTDDTVTVARQKGVNIFQLPNQSGVAAARNFGAQHAQGEILFFIDSDVLIRQDNIALVVNNFQHNPEIAAIFGSYDDGPQEENFISQYRNLFHHFHHQHSCTEAFSFWAGCGAMRKKVFEEMDGFNKERYTVPSIEDIELGYRIHKKGYRLLLDKDIQVKHLKRWGFLDMIRTDIFQRAIPWSRLILETGYLPNELNLKLSHKISSFLAALLFLMIPLFFLSYTGVYDISPMLFICLFSLIITGVILLNRKLYVFFVQKRGLVFVMRAFPLHLLYYFFSGSSFIFCWITYKIYFLRFLYRIVEGLGARA